MNDDDYLWDRSGASDAELRRLESLLGRYRHREPLRVVLLKPRRWLVRAGLSAAGAAAAFALFLALLPRFGQPGAEWKVRATMGQALIAGRLGQEGVLRAGDVLETDSRSRAEIRAGAVGRIIVEPGSTLRLVQTAGRRHRLALDRGRIEASLWSPPFTFSFAAPAATAFDVGCAFTLEARGGEDVVHVTSGWVQFQWEGRQELIPQGASSIALRGAGPGTPFFDDAPAPFRSALRTLSFGASEERPAALRQALDAARSADVYSLLRLGIRASPEERALIYDRAAALFPPPPEVTRAAFVARDGDALDRWTRALGLGEAKRWWLHWPDALR